MQKLNQKNQKRRWGGPMSKLWNYFVLLIFCLPLISAADVAYILGDASQVSASITSVLNELNLTFDVIRNSQIPSTDFGQYSLLLIAEDVKKTSFLPLNQINAVFLEKGTADEVWDIGNIGQTSSKKIEVEDESSFIFNQIQIPSNDEIEIYNTLSAIHYLIPSIQSGVKTAGIKLGTFRPVIAYSDLGDVRNVFFGAPEPENWNDNGKQIFKNSLNWIIEGIPNNPPVFTGPIPDIAWGQGMTFTLDLNDYFYDIDDDSLTFGINDTSPNTEIIVTQTSNGVFLFESNPGFVGEDWVVFYASDGKDNTLTNVINLSVIPIDNTPPVFQELNCETEVDEDTEHTCILEAIDYNDDELSFFVESESNLVCEITNNLLTYSPVENYNGIASCTLTVSDGELNDTRTLTLNVAPVNDAPEITSYSPSSNAINLYEGKTQLFSVETLDVDSETTISWFLNDVKQFSTSSSNSQFTFSQNLGSYLLSVLVSDGEMADSQTWNVIVKKMSDFTCSEVGGFIIEENTLCRGEIFKVKDTDFCCSIQPEPKFSDIDSCQILNNSIEIEIEEPTTSDEFELGDTIKVELKLENNLNDDKYADIEAYLYDLTDDKVIEEDSANVKVYDSNSRTLKFDIPIPDDLDLDNEYAILVKSSLEEDKDNCNQAYRKIEIKRPKENVALTSFDLPISAVCGETFTISIKLENIGSEKQDVKLSVKNSDLKISETSEEVTLERYGRDKNKKTIDFLLEIPKYIKSGFYTLTATVSYNSTRETYTKDIRIDCSSSEPQTVFDSQTISSQSDIINLNTTPALSSSSNSNKIFYIAIFSGISLIIVFVIFYFFILE